jgi:hypothetical protein
VCKKNTDFDKGDGFRLDFIHVKKERLVEISPDLLSYIINPRIYRLLRALLHIDRFLCSLNVAPAATDAQVTFAIAHVSPVVAFTLGSINQ